MKILILQILFLQNKLKYNLKDFLKNILKFHFEKQIKI